MRIKKIKQQLAVRLAVGVAALLFSADAMAATQSVTANLAFDTPLSFTNISNINFGTVVAGVASTYTITTAGVVTATGSGQWLYGTKQAGSVTIVGSATDTIAISVGGFSPSSHVTLANPTCTYGGTTLAGCAGTVAAPGTSGVTLLLGIDAAVTTGAVAGTQETPSLTVTVTYS